MKKFYNLEVWSGYTLFDTLMIFVKVSNLQSMQRGKIKEAVSSDFAVC